MAVRAFLKFARSEYTSRHSQIFKHISQQHSLSTTIIENELSDCFFFSVHTRQRGVHRGCKELRYRKKTINLFSTRRTPPLGRELASGKRVFVQERDFFARFCVPELGRRVVVKFHEEFHSRSRSAMDLIVSVSLTAGDEGGGH